MRTVVVQSDGQEAHFDDCSANVTSDHEVWVMDPDDVILREFKDGSWCEVKVTA